MTQVIGNLGHRVMLLHPPAKLLFNWALFMKLDVAQNQTCKPAAGFPSITAEINRGNQEGGNQRGGNQLGWKKKKIFPRIHTFTSSCSCETESDSLVSRLNFETFSFDSISYSRFRFDDSQNIRYIDVLRRVIKFPFSGIDRDKLNFRRNMGNSCLEIKSKFDEEEFEFPEINDPYDSSRYERCKIRYI